MYKGKQSDPFYHTRRWKAVRKLVLERDHAICQVCLRLYRAGCMDRPREANTVHHLIPRTERPDLELALDNLESICAIHHNQEHPDKGGSHGADRPQAARPRVVARIIKIQEDT